MEESPSLVTPPLSRLSGPDGKPLQSPEPAPMKRPMPTRKEKFDLVFMMFTLMTRAERQQLIKVLRPLRRRLDLMYPNGMTEGDIKNDLTKAIDAVVPDGEGHAEPQNAEIAAESSVPAQPEGDKDGAEVATVGEEGGC